MKNNHACTMRKAMAKIWDLQMLVCEIKSQISYEFGVTTSQQQMLCIFKENQWSHAMVVS